jgi:hypothetical protein
MSGPSLSVVGFAVLVTAALALELTARRRRSGVTAAEAIGAAMRTTAARAVVLLVWVWLGVHFLAR